ncbi:MAG TPA: tetrahydrofolate dehydrogenase/cyclohydrolase catalytic domain-containing protein [Bacillota bacterium]|jgi:methylenetetrahydrofolate dehydrogenase (NADP+)/methenyltetrahydrofolate cyclohydrolase
MGETLSGKKVAGEVIPELTARCKTLLDRGINPKLMIVRFGANPDDLFYEKGARKTCGQVGIIVDARELAPDADTKVLLAVVDELNNDPAVNGILMMQPFPKHIDVQAVRNRISPAKDVDGMSPSNEAKVYENDPTGFPPCTPTAVMEILKNYKVELKGKKAVVLGRSMVVGKPAAMLLLGEHASVTICHSRTADLAGEARQGDVLVAAIGRGKMVTKDFVKPGAVVIDVGINVDENGKMCGDVDFDSAAPLAGMITPVPGGVGSVTTTVLAKHVLKAAAAQADLRG